MKDDLTSAILQKLAFKNTEAKRYAPACILTALFHWPEDFAADMVLPEFKPAAATTAGCMIALLKSDGVHIFERVGRRASVDPDANARWINTYRLTSRALACTWLTANGFQAPDTADPHQLLLSVN